MAGYTTPKTWVVTDNETNTDWNTYVADNENSIRQFMYLPSKYSTFSQNLVSPGQTVVYTSADLLPAAPAEAWNFYVHVVIGVRSNYAGADLCGIRIFDRNGAAFTTQSTWLLMANGNVNYTPHAVLGFLTYASAGASLIPKFQITVELLGGTAGACAGLAFPYATPITE